MLMFFYIDIVSMQSAEGLPMSFRFLQLLERLNIYFFHHG